MSALEERSLDKLADMIYNVLWQDLLELWKIVRKKMDSEGASAVRAAFDGARTRFLEGTFKDMIDVRWGMSLCPLCNDDNIEKNGVAYTDPSGDGLEFNQCLNCRIGVLYNLVIAKATLETYVIGLGQAEQFNGMTFYWDAVYPESSKDLQPRYEIIKQGQWMGSVVFDEEMNPTYLPFTSMVHGVDRDATEPWVTDLPEEIKAAVDAFVETARDQIEVARVIR